MRGGGRRKKFSGLTFGPKGMIIQESLGILPENVFLTHPSEHVVNPPNMDLATWIGKQLKGLTCRMAELPNQHGPATD